MGRILIFCCFLLFFLNLNGLAQTRSSFTGGNTILVSIEGTSGLYEYTTNQLMVRYNANTQKMECIFNINSLLPANDSSPVVIVQDIFFAAKYPELLIEIEAPEGNAQVSSATPQPSNRNARLYMHGLPLDLVIPVTFSPDRRTMLFSSNFDLLLPDHQLTIPARYIPMLSGRIIFTIRNAQWVVLGPR